MMIFKLEHDTPMIGIFYDKIWFPWKGWVSPQDDVKFPFALKGYIS